MSEAPLHGLQVFDLTRLRGRDGLPDEADEPDAVELGFGQAHNIVANMDTGYVYVVGSTQAPAAECQGKRVVETNLQVISSSNTLFIVLMMWFVKHNFWLGRGSDSTGTGKTEFLRECHIMGSVTRFLNNCIW